MATDKAELAKRTQLALESIRRSLDTEEGEHGATLFANHHIEELDQSYWQAHLGTNEPNPAQVLGLLCLRPPVSEDEEADLDTLDFTLPGDVTNYVLCVRFDEDGAIDEIEMES